MCLHVHVYSSIFSVVFSLHVCRIHMYIGIHNHKFRFKRPLPGDFAVLDSCGIDDGVELVVGGISVVGGPGWS